MFLKEPATETQKAKGNKGQITSSSFIDSLCVMKHNACIIKFSGLFCINAPPGHRNQCATVSAEAAGQKEVSLGLHKAEGPGFRD